MIVNCHLHFDHCGGNPFFPGRPVLVQRTELTAARKSGDHTLPELVDYPGARYQELGRGDRALARACGSSRPRGTPTGTSRWSCARADGTVVLAGQAHDDATTYGRDLLAHQSGHDIPYPKWVERLTELDPRAIVFAHDAAVWMPGERKD